MEQSYMESSSADSNSPEHDKPLNLVLRNLRLLGALSLEEYLVTKPVHSPQIADKSAWQSSSIQAIRDDKRISEGNRGPHAVSKLYQACQRALGSTDGLKFDFLEDDPHRKQCIITVTRPEGTKRTYKSDPAYTRRTDAKSSAARIAIESGALDFIAHGSMDITRQDGSPISWSDMDITDTTNDLNLGPAGSSIIQTIEDNCIKWTDGRVKPHWVIFNAGKPTHKFGAALRISFSTSSFLVFATDAIYDDTGDAKTACAKLASSQGVMEYIQTTHNQGSETNPPLKSSKSSPGCATSLQSFYDTLPKRFLGPFHGLTASEINAPAKINTMLQSARGGQLRSTFFLVSDDTIGMHGCVFRLDRPSETRSYLVDAQFTKRSDAKAAVCLQAMSEGIEDYVRFVKEAVENKLSTEQRTTAHEKLIPLIASECTKISPKSSPTYNFSSERDAHGCTLVVDPIPTLFGQIPEYSVKPEYRSKADAKAAVAYVAVKGGLIEYLRFRGALPPPGYVPVWNTLGGSTLDRVRMKRKHEDDDISEDHKGKKEMKDDSLEEGEIRSHFTCMPTTSKTDLLRPKQKSQRQKHMNKPTRGRAFPSDPWVPPMDEIPYSSVPMLSNNQLPQLSQRSSSLHFLSHYSERNHHSAYAPPDPTGSTNPNSQEGPQESLAPGFYAPGPLQDTRKQ